MFNVIRYFTSVVYGYRQLLYVSIEVQTISSP
nr:MAG TPA: hypothetical protein [Caudoviricetes sp.]